MRSFGMRSSSSPWKNSSQALPRMARSWRSYSVAQTACSSSEYWTTPSEPGWRATYFGPLPIGVPRMWGGPPWRSEFPAILPAHAAAPRPPAGLVGEAVGGLDEPPQDARLAGGVAGVRHDLQVGLG